MDTQQLSLKVVDSSKGVEYLLYLVARGKISDGSDEILSSIRAGYVSYIINTRAILSGIHYEDGVAIRREAIRNGVTMFTSLDTVRIVLEVLEDITPRIRAI